MASALGELLQYLMNQLWHSPTATWSLLTSLSMVLDTQAGMHDLPLPRAILIASLPSRIFVLEIAFDDRILAFKAGSSKIILGFTGS